MAIFCEYHTCPTPAAYRLQPAQEDHCSGDALFFKVALLLLPEVPGVGATWESDRTWGPHRPQVRSHLLPVGWSTPDTEMWLWCTPPATKTSWVPLLGLDFVNWHEKWRCLYLTLPEDLMPLIRQRKTASQARAKQYRSSRRIAPMSSIPSVICRTWFLQWTGLDTFTSWGASPGGVSSCQWGQLWIYSQQGLCGKSLLAETGRVTYAQSKRLGTDLLPKFLTGCYQFQALGPTDTCCVLHALRRHNLCCCPSGRSCDVGSTSCQVCEGIILIIPGTLLCVPVIVTRRPWHHTCKWLEEVIQSPRYNNVVVDAYYSGYDHHAIAYAFEERGDVPDGGGAEAGKLAIGHFQEEERHAAQYKKGDVGDQEDSWNRVERQLELWCRTVIAFKIMV